MRNRPAPVPGLPRTTQARVQLAVPRQSLGLDQGGQPRTLGENHASTHIEPCEKVLDLVAPQR